MKNGQIIILDLDGTLYNHGYRQHLAQNGLWDEFHEASSMDEPNRDVLKITETLQSAGYTILAVSGRNERYRHITKIWFNHWAFWPDDLLMRPDGDYTPDHELKPRMLMNWLEENQQYHQMDDIVAAFDDRDKVVAAWRSMGIPCWQVREGAF